MKQKKNKGQALVEFAIILPIFIFMVLASIDIGKVLYYQNHLESQMDEVITIYEKNASLDEVNTYLKKAYKKESIDINTDNKYLEFNLKKSIDIITPGLNLIFKSPYQVSVKRVITYES